MSRTILVTGGAGFIGSHLVDALVGRGERVRVLDRLEAQVHGPGGGVPASLSEHLRSDRVELLREDLREPGVAGRALEGVDAVFHQAAAVGVGQSMYRISDYVSANTLGTARLLQAIADRDRPLGKLVVASSMSVYGEGAYRCEAHGTVEPPPRSDAQLAAGEWEMRCPGCGGPTKPVATPESKSLAPTSVYAVTKRDQEELCLTVGRAYGVPTVALRYFNVYGPRQALGNPYTGVAAIFTARLRAGKPPPVFEDGRQSRDFVHVSDVVRANLAALDEDVADRVYNVGTGRALDLLDLVGALRRELGGPEPELLVSARKGDVRHCFADVSRIGRELGFEAEVPFEDGVRDLVDWARTQGVEDRVERATAELTDAGLTL